MSSTTRPLTDSEFIQQALNHYFHYANEKLASKALGDMERENYEFIKKRSKTLMDELDRNNKIVTEAHEAKRKQIHIVISHLYKPNWNVDELLERYHFETLVVFFRHLKTIKPNWSVSQMLDELKNYQPQ